jgi:hypothetical protein
VSVLLLTDACVSNPLNEKQQNALYFTEKWKKHDIKTGGELTIFKLSERGGEGGRERERERANE